MAESPLAVLLRDGSHSAATTRFALKCDQFSIAISKTPIQVPVPRSTPILLDMGSNRPSITISGLVDNVGGDTSNTTSGFEHMDSLTVSGPDGSGGTISHPYYIPYKNYLENKLITWVTGDQDVQVEIGDSSVVEGGIGSSTPSTGGGLYKVIIQQCNFAVAPATEDRWMFTIQFAASIREGISF